jgi:ABC-type branched-subunit amino acid transport system ATPase component
VAGRLRPDTRSETTTHKREEPDENSALVEQNAYGALKIADRGYVLETGRVTMSGPAEELGADPHPRSLSGDLK